MPSEEQVTDRFVSNHRWDFNQPWKKLAFHVGEHEPKVGDLARLVDMDPTAGTLLVRITSVEEDTQWSIGISASGREYRWAHFEEVAGSYQPWEPQEQGRN